MTTSAVLTEGVVTMARLALAGGLAIGMVLLARHLDQTRRDRSRREYLVRFPRDLTPEATAAFLKTLSGLAAPRQGRFGRDSVVLAVIGRRGAIEHRLWLPRGSAAYFLAQLRAAVPSVGLTPVLTTDERLRLPRWTVARELRLTSSQVALSVDDAAATSRTILAACSGLAKREVVIWQWTVAGGTPQASGTDAGMDADDWLDRLAGRLTPGTPVDRGPARTRKRAHGLSRAALRVGAYAADPARGRALTARLLRAAGSVSSPGARLVPRRLPGSVAIRRLRLGRTPLIAFPVLVTPPELLALSGWPLGSPAVPGLVVGASAQLEPSPQVPRRGRRLGISTSGKGRPVAQSLKGAVEHTLVVAPTGTGKSVLAARLALGDIAGGRGVLVLDPKGSLVRAICDRLPEAAIPRTVLVDPTDAERPVPLPLLAGDDGAMPEAAADGLIALLRQRFHDLGPRSTDIIASSLYALATVPGATLMDLIRLWHDARFRATVRPRVASDPALAAFFAWFDGLSPAERNLVLAAPMNKLRPLISRPLVRNVLAAPRATFSVPEALRRNQIVLVTLPEGVLGADAVTLLGQVLLGRVWAAVQARGTQRPPYLVTVDEAPRFLDQPTDIADALARSREYGVGLTLITQSLAQLPPNLREVALNSARSKVAFQSSAADARRLADEFGPTVTPDMLTGLGAYEAMARVSVGSAVTDPFTFRSEALGPVVPGRYAAVRAASRQRYGVPRDEIEASFSPAAQPPDEGIGPVGRRYDS